MEGSGLSTPGITAYVPKVHHQVVAAAIRVVFIQADHAAAKTWRQVADQLRQRIPKLAAMMDEAEADIIGYPVFPKSHWPKLHSTNPIDPSTGSATVLDVEGFLRLFSTVAGPGTRVKASASALPLARPATSTHIAA